MVPSPDANNQRHTANSAQSGSEQSLQVLVDLLLNLEAQKPEAATVRTEPTLATNRFPLSNSTQANQANGTNGGGEAQPPAPSGNQSLPPTPFPQPAKIQPPPTRFLQQSEQDIRFVLQRLEEKIAHLEHKVEEPTELINPLLPLITELLALKTTEANHSLLQAVVPIIAEVIHLRGQQDAVKMGAALGELLPVAITHRIQHSPTTIAKALAPEFALALQEQIRLDPDAVSQSLGPQMGEAIKTQIRVEREAMVDALYPVIGSTISKYMVDLVKTINEKVEGSLSPERIWRKIRARIKGVSEAELILQESLGFKIQAALLVHKTSGLVIRALQPAGSFQIESDMLAGMLTAIRSFVSECMTHPGSDSELHEIEYNASKIMLEVAGYCYLAVIVKGEPSKALLATMRATLGDIVLKAGKQIANYDGDPQTVPASVDLCLDRLLQAEPKANARSKSPMGLLVLLGLILLPLGFIAYRGHIAREVEAKTSAALDGVPELSVFRLEPEVQAGKLVLTGRLPTPYLRQRAETVARQAAQGWPLKNEILTIEVPPDSTATAGEVKRVIWIFNQKPGVAVVAKHSFGEPTVSVTGVVSQVQDSQQLTQALQKIPGITSVTNTVQIRPVVETQIYFEVGSSRVDVADNLTRLSAIRRFLDENPGVALKLIGHSDPTGEQSHNQQLSLERARNVQQLLINQGISPGRLQIEASSGPPPEVTGQQPLKLSRSVRFEVIIPTGK